MQLLYRTQDSHPIRIANLYSRFQIQGVSECSLQDRIQAYRNRQILNLKNNGTGPGRAPSTRSGFYNLRMVGGSRCSLIENGTHLSTRCESVCCSLSGTPLWLHRWVEFLIASDLKTNEHRHSAIRGISIPKTPMRTTLWKWPKCRRKHGGILQHS